MFECGPSPPVAVRELLAVLHHEISVMLDAWRLWRTGVGFLHFRDPVDFRHLGAVRERLAIVGSAFLEGVDHDGIAPDHGDLAFVLTDRNDRPIFVSLNSEKARPPGTCTVYLSCKETALPPGTASTAATAAEAARTRRGVGNNGILDMIIVQSLVKHVYAASHDKVPPFHRDLVANV
jgi:hypothetical protein